MSNFNVLIDLAEIQTASLKTMARLSKPEITQSDEVKNQLFEAYKSFENCRQTITKIWDSGAISSVLAIPNEFEKTFEEIRKRSNPESESDFEKRKNAYLDAKANH